MVVKLSQAINDTLSFNVQVEGTATQGTDYTLNIPSVITFAPGLTQLNFPLFPINDAIAEGDETIIINLFKNYGCGQLKVASLTVIIRDKAVVSINAGIDTAVICKDGQVRLQAVGTQTFAWSPVSVFNNPSIANPLAKTNTSQWVTVTGTVGGVCVAKDSIYLKIVEPKIDIIALSDTNICEGKTVKLLATNNLNNAGIKWVPVFGVNDPTSPSVTITTNFSQVYTATATISGCSVSDQINIKVDPYDLVKVQKDTTICQNSSITLGFLNPFDTFFVQTVFQWTPSMGLKNPTKWNAVATPDTTTTYQLISKSPTGICRDTFNVKLTVIPADVDILSNNIIRLCKGDAVQLNTNSSTNGAGLTWSPSVGLNTTTGASVTATPTKSQVYKVQLVSGVCTVFDSVSVLLDSLPIAPITNIPSQQPYCPGEIVSLVSPDFAVGNYPLIQYSWLSNVGFLTPLSNYNAVINIGNLPTTYVRVIRNGACVDTVEVKIDVLQPAAEISLTDTIICFGQRVSVELKNLPAGATIAWLPNEPSLISCNDCPNPTLTPKATTSYKATVTVKNGCSASATVMVNIDTRGLQIDATPSNLVEIGDTVTVKVVSLPIDTLGNYIWLLNGNSLPDRGYVITKIIGEAENLFKVTLTSSRGCVVEDTILILATEPIAQIPNAFSPDGDNVNDKFNIVAKTLSLFTVKEFRVYSRWGELVYNNEKPSEGWDGSKGDNPLPPDVYAYSIEITLPSGKTKKLTGQVTLLR